jgi:hypothetical protein
MNGSSIIGSIALPNPGPAWQLEGSADFNGDGKSDLLFLNPSTGQVQIWLMNGTQVTSMQAPTSGALPAAPSNATPLSSAPVLGAVDGYFPSGYSGLGGAMLAGPDPSGLLGGAGPPGAATIRATFGDGNLFTHA